MFGGRLVVLGFLGYVASTKHFINPFNKTRPSYPILFRDYHLRNTNGQPIENFLGGGRARCVDKNGLCMSRNKCTTSMLYLTVECHHHDLVCCYDPIIAYPVVQLKRATTTTVTPSTSQKVKAPKEKGKEDDVKDKVEKVKGDEAAGTEAGKEEADGEKAAEGEEGEKGATKGATGEAEGAEAAKGEEGGEKEAKEEGEAGKGAGEGEKAGEGEEVEKGKEGEEGAEAGGKEAEGGGNEAQGEGKGAEGEGEAGEGAGGGEK